MDSTDQTQQPPDEPRRLRRSRTDRVIGGVCAGVGRYLKIDPLIVRVAAVALTFLGGLGALAYLGALLLVPDEEGNAIANTSTTGGRLLTALGVVALVAAAGVVLSGAAIGAVTVVAPIAVLGLVGLLTWALVSGQGFEGGWWDITRRSLLGLAVLCGSAVVFACGVWLAGTGGGELAAALVIGAGVAIAVGAFLRPVRWLIPPALGLALGVGFVSAAGIDLDGGVGEREYRPTAASDIRDRYEVGAGRLVVDLREAQLPRGDVPVSLDVGMGEAVLLVPENVCVASRAQVGMGAVEVFDRDNGGVDLDWEDRRRAAPTTTRVVVDADVGAGLFQVRHHAEEHRGRRFRGGRRWSDHDHDRGEPGNRACSPGGARASG
jgi:phage shock protein PspC (stress-responsive transcriptional regulator)